MPSEQLNGVIIESNVIFDLAFEQDCLYIQKRVRGILQRRRFELISVDMVVLEY